MPRVHRAKRLPYREVFARRGLGLHLPREGIGDRDRQSGESEMAGNGLESGRSGRENGAGATYGRQDRGQAGHAVRRRSERAGNASGTVQVGSAFWARVERARPRVGIWRAFNLALAALMPTLPPSPFRHPAVAGLHLQSCGLCRRAFEDGEAIGLAPVLHLATGYPRHVPVCLSCFPASVKANSMRRRCEHCGRTMHVRPESPRRCCSSRCYSASYYRRHRAALLEHERVKYLRRRKAAA